MHIGIIELMETGHIGMADTIARIFSSEKSNNISIYTTGKHAVFLQQLVNSNPDLKIIRKPEEQDLTTFLKNISGARHDRLYVVTMNRFFPEFARWEPGSPLFIVLHNLDEWFGFSITQRVAKFLNAVKLKAGIRSLIYFLKVYFIHPSYKSTILKKVTGTGGKIVVLSESVKHQLQLINKELPVEVIPFSVYDSLIAISLTEESGPLRICVPGMVSQHRRDYLGLLEIMNKEFWPLKEMFSVDFLGGVQKGNPLNECETILKRTGELIDAGYSILVHKTEFIPPEEYDRQLAGCDVILGNMNVVLNKFSVYGKTKETGLPFAMIKAGKPGILPSSYPLPSEIRSQIITYDSFDQLAGILKKLIKERSLVKELQETAKVNSRLFSPDKIYRKLLLENQRGI